MDISITGVTAQRKFGKTLVRLAPFLDELRDCCDDLETDSESFDVLQLVFKDKPESFLEANGLQGDRLYQVAVGMGVARDFGPETDRTFLCFVADQALQALPHAPLNAELRDAAQSRIEKWACSIGGEFE